MSINLQDYLAIVASILGPILTFMGFMWNHFNSRFEKIDSKISSVEEKLVRKISNVEEKLGADIKRVEEKIDAVRDRVSRIEGQLVPAKVISFEETRPKQTARPIHSKAAQAH